MALATPIHLASSSSPFDERRFETLLRTIEERRDDFHRARHVSQDIIEELRTLGLYRAFVPEQFGGSGMAPTDFLQLIERIACADGSAGWVASFAFASKYLASLPAETLRELYAEGPDVVFAGCVFPPQPARRVEGGFVVRGRWPFASGCNGASILGVGILSDSENDGGLPRMAVMPAEKAEIDETWNAVGMRGTGSHDLIVEDVFVPDAWTFVRGSPPTLDTAAYRYPTLAMASQVLAVCGLGVARAALEYVIGDAASAPSITGAPSIADRPHAHLRIGEMEASLRSARAWFYEVTDSAWAALLDGGSASQEQTVDLRLASTHAARVGAQVARGCYEVCGTIGIYEHSPLSRYVADASVVAQHAFIAEGSFLSAGKILAGHAPAPGFP